jgi:hypothetical protein
MSPSSPFTPIKFCHFVFFNISNSLTQCNTLRFLFAIHYLACKRKPLRPKPHLKCVCAFCIIYEQCAFSLYIQTFNYVNNEYVLWTCNGNVACEIGIEWKLPNYGAIWKDCAIWCCYMYILELLKLRHKKSILKTCN